MINATKMTSGDKLTLSGSGIDSVSGLSGALDASAATGALTATLAGAATQSVTLGSAGATITDSAGGAVLNATHLLDGNTLTLRGTASATVSDLVGDGAATSLSGALNLTTGAASTINIATGSGATTIHAEAMSAHELLGLTGSHSATLYVGGDLTANLDTGALTVFATGSGAQTIQTGSGADTITALLGNDTIWAGGGADSIDVLGHAAADTFVYSAIGDSTNAAGKQDTITGFVAAGAFNDTIDFSALNAQLAVGGPLTGTSIAAHSIGWTYSGGAAEIFVNNTAGTLSLTSSTLLEVNLSGVASGLAASTFKA